MTHVSPPQARVAGSRLDWLEVGRGLAAFGVVLTHFTPWQDAAPGSLFAGFRGLGGYSVEFFFVLSGFIILHVHGRDLDTPAALPRYAWRRLIRVLPTYWVTLALCLVVNQTVQIAWARAELTPVYLLRQLLLLPGDLMIGQAWTLRHELLFYAVFLVMIAHRRIGLGVFVLWMAVAVGQLAVVGLPPGQVSDGPGIIVHHYNIDFALGMALAVATRRGRVGSAALIAAAAAAAIVLATAWTAAPADFWPVMEMKLIFAAIVGGAALLSIRRVPAPSWLIGLGAMSYALYISHELFGTAVSGVFRRLAVAPPPVLLFGLKIASALVGAAILHRGFERPALRRLARLGDRGAPPVAARPVLRGGGA